MKEDGLENMVKSQKIQDKAKRRVFTPKYKQSILKEIEETKGKRGAVGSILRREGLYATQVTSWRKELEDELAGIFKKKRGPKPDPTKSLKAEIDRLTKKNARLTERLRQSDLVIEAQKKIAMMIKTDQESSEEIDN
jgi:transposase-like protein